MIPFDSVVGSVVKAMTILFLIFKYSLLRKLLDALSICSICMFFTLVIQANAKV